MNDTNTIIEEKINEFLEDLEIPTYLRNEVKKYADMGDLATATYMMSSYFSAKNLSGLFNSLFPKEKLAW